MIKANELMEHIGEECRVTTGGYFSINGVYVLVGIQQTVQLNGNNAKEWTLQACFRERGTRCSIWVNAKKAEIVFLNKKEDFITEKPENVTGQAVSVTENDEADRIREIQQRTMKTIKNLQ